MAQIFLCHGSEDSAQVEEIYRRLQGLGLQPWMETLDLLPGQQWQQAIPTALKGSDVVLVFLSRQSVAQRSSVQGAFQLALATLEALPAGAIPTMLVRLDACDVPEQFAELPWVEGFPEEGFKRVVQALQ